MPEAIETKPDTNRTESPIIGITADNAAGTTSPRYEVTTAYTRAVADAGGLPVILPHEPELAENYARLCDGLLLTGGGDPATEEFGEPTHPKARIVDPRRQAFELALLRAADARPNLPVLGVCLGMQMMALHAGGRLHQYLPDVLADAAVHEGDRVHAVILANTPSALLQPDGRDESLTVISAHRQSIAPPETLTTAQPLTPLPGGLRVIAMAPDGVIEAIDHPDRRWYLGVQWHPERGGDTPLGVRLIKRWVEACRYGRPTTSAHPSPQPAPRPQH